MPPRPHPSSQGPHDGFGFTLVEILVALSILGLLVAILLPVLGAARDAARITACQSNLRQHGIAIGAYTNDYKDVFPTNPDRTVPPFGPNLDSYQYRHYWLTIRDYLPAGNWFDGSADEVSMDIICPAYAARWPSQAFDSPRYTANPWQFRPDIAGYHANFANFSANFPANNPEWHFRSLGGMRQIDVGSKAGQDPVDVGAVPATTTDRMIMLNDAAFSTTTSEPFPPEHGEFGHQAGWSALFVDGHADFFEQPNDQRPWYARYRLKDAL